MRSHFRERDDDIHHYERMTAPRECQLIVAACSVSQITAHFRSFLFYFSFILDCSVRWKCFRFFRMMMMTFWLSNQLKDTKNEHITENWMNCNCHVSEQRHELDALLIRHAKMVMRRYPHFSCWIKSVIILSTLLQLQMFRNVHSHCWPNVVVLSHISSAQRVRSMVVTATRRNSWTENAVCNNILGDLSKKLMTCQMN